MGLGELTSGLLLVNLLKGLNPQKALEHVTAGVYEVMKQTKESSEYELQVVVSQDKIALLQHYFSVSPVI